LAHLSGTNLGGCSAEAAGLGPKGKGWGKKGGTVREAKRLLRVVEAADELNLSPKTIWAMIYRRDLEVVRIGRSVRIAQTTLDQLIEQGTVPAVRR
jgi:excisionase family DNA binding protein